MQTNFTLAQLADPDTAVAEKILRSCVHCGFCTATCPTYVLLGDELDSPRGRIYLIKDMLENDKPANEEVTLHIDRCLSCLACMTTCPSGVDYMHLVDHARARIQQDLPPAVVRPPDPQRAGGSAALSRTFSYGDGAARVGQALRRPRRPDARHGPAGCDAGTGAPARSRGEAIPTAPVSSSRRASARAGSCFSAAAPSRCSTPASTMPRSGS